MTAPAAVDTCTHPLSVAVERIGCRSVDWLIRKLRARQFPGRKVGREWRMTDSDIAESIRLLAVPAIIAVPDSTGLSPNSGRRRARRAHSAS